MKTLEFYGNSDGTFGEYGITGQDCDNCGNGKPIQCVVDCGDRGRVLVVGQFNGATLGSGCWTVGVTKVDECDEAFPDWNFRYRESDVPYSPALLMDLPVMPNLEWYIDGRRVTN